ncbi:MAG: hypothetical protein CVU69_12305 [Deltaproteobacteria bacterium HGW-Deltaproteobacteria-4]|nr:MAG: hypothetical protein CVU69_12305 [Deltaproteobacteria bacterium HGW-Deltaproteobacteria-4]
MKSCDHFIPVSVPFQHNQRFQPVKSKVGTRSGQQRRLLLGVSFLLILSWTVGAILLISMRRGERDMAEVLAQQRAIAASFSREISRSR